MIPGHLPRRMPKSSQKSPLCTFLIEDGRHHVTPFSKKQGYYLFSLFFSWKKYLGVSTYVLMHKELIQMIRNDISTLLINKNQDGRHIILNMFGDLLKNLVVEPQIYFWPNPWHHQQ